MIEIDRLRLRATSSLLERTDVILVASLCCIYGLGSPEEYRHSLVILEKGENIDRNDVMRKLTSCSVTVEMIFFRRPKSINTGIRCYNYDSLFAIEAEKGWL